MLKYFQQWRMKNQLKLYFLLLTALSTILLAVLLAITQTLVNKEIELTTQQISTKIAKHDVQRQFVLQTQMFYDVIYRSMNIDSLDYQTLNKIAQLYQFALKQKDLEIQSSDQCPKNQSQAYGISNICFNVFNLPYGEQPNSNIDVYLKHNSLLQETLLLFDPEQYVVGNWSVGYGKYYLFYAYKAIGYYSNFNIAQRPFYANHVTKSHTSKYIFSDVFYNFEGQYKVTISRNLTSDVVDGIVATQFEFKIIKKFFQENFLILNKAGMILIGNSQSYFTPNQTDIYLFNESITGFNQDDWNSIQNQMENITVSNCTSNFDSSFLCRHNKKTQKDVMIFVKYLDFSNLTLLLFKDIVQDVDLDNQLQVIRNSTNELIVSVILYQLLTAFGASIIAIFVVIYICRYMKYLEELANNHLQNKPVDLKIATFLRQLKHQEHKNSSNVIWNLLDQYYKLILQLTEKPFNKNQECKIFESFQFPIMKKGRNCVSKIRDSLQALSDTKKLRRISRPTFSEIFKNRSFCL